MMLKSHNKNTRFFLFNFGIAALILASSCAKQKTVDKMQFDELSQQVSTAIEEKKREKAITYLEEMLTRFPDHKNIAHYKMLLAEMYFKDSKYAASQGLYEHFNQFYPADKKAEYAKYKSILAMFYQTLDSDRDQSETEQTVALCREYLDKSAFKKYRKDVHDILTSCQNRLIDKEVYVFNFYLKQGHLDAAEKRLTHLKNKYLEDQRSLQPRLLYLECKLAHRKHNTQQALNSLKKLKQLYPKSQFTSMAESIEGKDTFEL